MKQLELIVYVVPISLIRFAVGSWFLRQSEPKQANDTNYAVISRNYPSGESSVIACALRCTLANGACMLAASSGSNKTYCSLSLKEENMIQPTEPGIQIFQYTDLDECLLGLHNCDQSAICTNTIASFTCSCPAGHVGDGTTECVNVDECATGTAQCHDDADCTDTEGSYTCQCKPGFQGDGRTCENINECTKGTHNCSSYSSSCVDQMGSFSCKCNSGFLGDGNTCRATLGISFSKQASSVPNSFVRVTHHRDLSVCLWVNYQAAGSILKVWYEPSQDRCFTLSIYIHPSLSSIQVSGPGFIPTPLPTTKGAWHHICATRSPSIQSLYLDKVEYFMRRDPYPDIPQSNLHISIGNPDDDDDSCPGNNGVNNFRGKLKDVFVWTVKLTVEEVKLVYDGSDFPNRHRCISWTGAFNKPGRYPEQTKISFTSEQLDEIHGSKA